MHASPDPAPAPPQEPQASADDDHAAIRNILRRVADPEVGLNIVDLGLIYRIEDLPSGLRIEMTMTSPACPMGDLILDEVRAELASARPQAPPAEIVLVWNPPWDPSMMSARGKLHLGW